MAKQKKRLRQRFVEGGAHCLRCGRLYYPPRSLSGRSTHFTCGTEECLLNRVPIQSPSLDGSTNTSDNVTSKVSTIVGYVALDAE